MPTRDLAQPVRKQYEIKAASLQDNYLKGAASVTGVLDRGRDVIFPGSWQKSLKGFRQNGFVAVGHDWRSLPVAMPTSVKEDGNQLLTEAEFHSTQAAQDARTVCTERLAKSLSVGLSVGFLLDCGDDDKPPYQYFESGQKLLDFAKANGYDMSLFDVKGIKACNGWCCGILGIAELIEYSIVPVPCNQMATATDAKSFNIGEIQTERDFEAFLRDAGYSRKDATAISLYGYKALQRDAGEAEADQGAGEAGTEADAEEGNGLDAAAVKSEADKALQSLALRALSARANALRLYLPA